MAQKYRKLAIVFADISGSTRLYDTLGDATARQLVSQCLGLMSEMVKKYRGIVIKTIGDEIMCTYRTAEEAIESAMVMQEAVSEDLPNMNPDAPADLTIRIGLHFGPIIIEGSDVFGDAVNVAARMAGLAKGGQIITTQETINETSAALQASARHLDRLNVKGKAEEINIFEVIWQQEDVTRMSTGLLSTQTVKAKLKLDYRGKVVVVNQQQSGPVVMGRGKKVDLTIGDGLASREHAKVEMRRGKFVLTDQSTNGTYVMMPEGMAYLRRDEVTLAGTGQISLGRDFKEDPTEIVNYTCEN